MCQTVRHTGQWQKRCCLFFFSTLIVSGSATFGWLIYSYYFQLRADDPAYFIKEIVQTGPEREALKTLYLAELLELSIDKPTNIYRLSLKESQKKLLQSPVIYKAYLQRKAPSTLLIDYSVRNPIAKLYDFENAVVDREGVVFPHLPFYTPKRLPEIYLGASSSSIEWGDTLLGKESALAFELLELLSRPPFEEEMEIQRIDVATAFDKSYGQRQIVLVLKGGGVLRLSKRYYKRELYRFLSLQKNLKESNKELEPPFIVDLRIPLLAFLQLDNNLLK